jgi:hypothetical protein
MNCHWRNKHNKSSVNFIKSEIAGKMTYKYNCKDFYMFVLNEKDILEPAK